MEAGIKDRVIRLILQKTLSTLNPAKCGTIVLPGHTHQLMSRCLVSAKIKRQNQYDASNRRCCSITEGARQRDRRELDRGGFRV